MEDKYKSDIDITIEYYEKNAEEIAFEEEFDSI